MKEILNLLADRSLESCLCCFGPGDVSRCPFDVRLLSGKMTDETDGPQLKECLHALHVEIVESGLINQAHVLFGHHASFPHSIFFNSLKRLYGTPYIVQFHGSEIYYARRSNHHRLIFRETCGLADQIIVSSKAVADAALSLAPDYVANKIIILPLASNQEFFVPVQGINRAKQNLPSLLYVGRLDDNKGLSLLLDAIELTSVSSLTLNVVGHGPKQHELMVRSRQLQREGIDVVFHGWKTPTEVRSFMDNSDVVVIPTQKFEGFCLVACEAMARGVPVVVTNIGALPEVVADAAYVCDVNARSLAAALDELLTDKRKLKRLALAGRARAEKFFRPEQMGDRYAEALQQIIALR